MDTKGKDSLTDKHQLSKNACLIPSKISDDVSNLDYCKKLLSECQSRYECLFENWLMGIFITDSKGYILECNQTFNNMFGYESNELLNKSVEILFHPEYRDQTVKYKSQINQKEKTSIETILIRKDGTPLTVEIFGTQFIYHESIGVLNVVRNIIERKQIEFAHLSRLSTLDEMVTNLAHELNQPLGAISNFAQGCIRRLQNGNGNHHELINAIQQIIKQSERAANIIQRIRHFVSNGKLKFVKFSLNEMIKESINFLEAEAKQTQTKIETDFSNKIPSIYADKIQLEQVLINIIKNAIEAVKECPLDERKVMIKTHPINSNTVEISISDQGIGLDKEIRNKIFEPFFTTKANGMGMGLAISKTIIESHGGELSLCSKKTKGACFKILLPIRQEM